MSSDLEKRLINELELDTALEKHREILEKSSMLIWQEIVLRISDEVSEQDQNDCEAYLEKEGTTPQAMLSFLSARSPVLISRIVEESFQEIVRQVKPILDRSRAAAENRWIDHAGKIYGEIYKKRQRRERRQKLFLKIFGPIFGWVVSWLLFIALAKLGIIPMYWIPNWMKRMFW